MSSTTPKVLLIGWDGADWEHIDPLIEAGLMPTLHRFIGEGVIGNLATLQPVLSPMLWNSVATGKFADKHGIHGFIEPDPENGGARPYSSTSRTSKALWNIFTQQGLRSNVVGWWASHPAEPINGTIVANTFKGVKFEPGAGWKIAPGTVHPPELAGKLAPFRISPSELTHEHVFPFIPNADRIDQANDPRLEMFAKVLSETASTHAVATAVMENEPWDFMAVYYDAIDHFCHGFMEYHPPRMPHIPEADFEIYKDVVTGAYRFHDMMLERMLQLAGPDATVVICSDHGFESGVRRPRGVPREPAGPAVWHRQYGILAMRGPGLKRGERLYGASLIDMAPTILSMYGLPIGEDMDGRPLVEAFAEPPAVETIPSWEDVPGACGMHDAGSSMDRAQADELMQQFIALGYIEDPGDDKEKQAESADVEAKYNVARTYLWTNRPDDARPLLEDIVRRHPWEDRFLLQLGVCYLRGGYLRQAEHLLRENFDLEDAAVTPTALLLWGNVKLALRERDEGLQSLLRAERLAPNAPGLQNQIGDVYVRLRRWDDAKRAYEKAIELDDDSARAHQGLSTVYRHQGLNQETCDAALDAVGLLHRLPMAHFNLGIAMARTGNPAQAVVAFETALQFSPEMFRAHRWLAALYRGPLADPAKAEHHRREVERLLGAMEFKADRRRGRQEERFDLPAIPSPKERRETLLRERPDPARRRRPSGRTFVLVSGLPRSGTSMMMQMLDAGGLASMTDGERRADDDNPKGYFEWEALKQIAKCPDLLDDDLVEARAVKAVTALLPKLPPNHAYKVVFMVRPVEEVVASQTKMIDRLGTAGADVDAAQLIRGLTVHRDETIAWMKRSPNVEYIEIDYPALVSSPETIIPKIVDFLGTERLPSAEAMATVVDPSLHRQRNAA